MYQLTDCSACVCCSVLFNAFPYRAFLQGVRAYDGICRKFLIAYIFPQTNADFINIFTNEKIHVMNSFIIKLEKKNCYLQESRILTT